MAPSGQRIHMHGKQARHITRAQQCDSINYLILKPWSTLPKPGPRTPRAFLLLRFSARDCDNRIDIVSLPYPSNLSTNRPCAKKILHRQQHRTTTLISVKLRAMNPSELSQSHVPSPHFARTYAAGSSAGEESQLDTALRTSWVRWKHRFTYSKTRKN